MVIKNIFITGATGFVGSHLVRRLQEKDFSLVLFVLPSEIERAEALFGKSNIIIREGDITKKESIAPAIEGSDSVIHLAAVTSAGTADVYKKINVEGTRNIVEACRSACVKRIFFTSSIDADSDYGAEYGASKKEAEGIIKSSGIPYLIIRPTVIVGKGDIFLKNILKSILKYPVIPIVGNGEYKRQPLYVEDIIKAVEAWLEMSKANDVRGVYAMGGGSILTFNEIIDLVSNVLNIRKKKIYLPLGMVKRGASIVKCIAKNSGIPLEQIMTIDKDKVTSNDAVIRGLGVAPRPFGDGIGELVSGLRGEI